MSEQSDMAAYAAAMEPEVPTEMGKLWEKHLAVTRQHLRVANCFSALRDFEKGFGKLKGVGNLVFEIGHSRGQLEAGIIRLQLRKDDVFHVAGHWSVTEEGDATVEFAQVTTVSCPGPQLGTELRRLIGSKQLKLILDRVSMEANLASFLPEFGEE